MEDWFTVNIYAFDYKEKRQEVRITNGSDEVEFDILAIDFERGGTAGHGGEVSGCRQSQDGFWGGVFISFFGLVIVVVGGGLFCWWLLWWRRHSVEEGWMQGERSLRDKVRGRDVSWCEGVEDANAWQHVKLWKRRGREKKRADLEHLQGEIIFRLKQKILLLCRSTVFDGDFRCASSK